MADDTKEIVLSVDETNALRAKLGLAPLRIRPSPSSDKDSNASHRHDVDDPPPPSSSKKAGDSEEIALSVSETNSLRERLGLPPLRDTGSQSENAGRKASEAIHARPINEGEAREARKRVEESKLKRDVEEGIKKLTAEASAGSEDKEEGALDFAARMRAQAAAEKKGKKKKKKKKKAESGGGPMSIPADEDEGYSERDLEGIQVSHGAGEFASGETTILTLADRSLLESDEKDSEGNVLENVQLKDAKTVSDNLRKKREVEMGMGRAGGYAGYDDDEFVELGGTGAVSNVARGGGGAKALHGEDGNDKGKGFRIGQQQTDEGKGGKGSDLFASHEGKAVSLVTTSQNTASDFMTEEEIRILDKERLEEEERKERKRQKKLEKRAFKKREKKDRKKKRRRREEDDDDDKKGDEGPKQGAESAGSSLLEDLESTAAGRTGSTTQHRGARKRRRAEDDSDEENGKDDKAAKVPTPSLTEVDVSSESKEPSTTGKQEKDEEEEEDTLVLEKRRAKFDTIMEKGNVRTDAVFRTDDAGNKSEADGRGGEEEEDGEEDDAFLTAALAKARRLKRLRELNATNENTAAASVEGGAKAKKRGAEAVVQSLQHQEQQHSGVAASSLSSGVGGSGGSGGITFEFDETREFTRALRARAEQAERTGGRTKSGVTVSNTEEKKKQIQEKEEPMDVDEDDNVDMNELAQHLSDDDADAANPQSEGEMVGGFGGTAATVPVGRGLSNFVSMLRHTGDITGPHAGKEELRGRAKDRRTYEDYEPLNLNEVVQIDRMKRTSGSGGSAAAHEKDLELANREVKLEYRDKHGRLLTRSEAWRQMCYQFHGYGSSKKNEERRLAQIARERAEGSVASRQAGGGGGGGGGLGGKGSPAGTLGALKATQRATGKAFVVHRT